MWTLLLTLAVLLFASGCSRPDAPPRADDARRASAPEAVVSPPRAESGVEPAALFARLDGRQPPLVLDVRTPEEFAAGHVPGAVLLPHDQVGRRLGELPADRNAEIIVYCRTGRRAAAAIAELRAASFTNVRELRGHMPGWAAGGLPVSDAVACC